MKSPGLNFRHLYYFWVVAKEGSVTRAAERLDVAIQTISAQLSLLEQSLGKSLLAPQGRRLVLTEAGRVALAYADQIFLLGEQLQEVLRHHVLRRGEQGRMAVRFTLQDGRVSAVETRDGPARYQPYVRLAVAGLQCSGGTQQHSFEIDFRRA